MVIFQKLNFIEMEPKIRLCNLMKNYDSFLSVVNDEKYLEISDPKFSIENLADNLIGDTEKLKLIFPYTTNELKLISKTIELGAARRILIEILTKQKR